MIETPRLTLRNWRDRDVIPFNAMCRDPEVMRYLGSLQSRPETRAAVTRLRAQQDATGYTFWAVERREDRRFLGFCGLKTPPPGIPVLDGLIEIGWRLARDAWGAGYAREAAEASLAWGWANLANDRIIAMTVLGNTRSWGLMERLGMVRQPAMDFDHPALADGDPLKPHIVYAIDRPPA
ncbi:MAG: GNAT family N-acetyltransferase [Alphaproteobacteria bacterium PA4]|nr:MAG: GNAT family N-acetyltransferase [Alphaproteobacteria bacterium PA4]